MTIADYDLVDIGIEHSQYFQGFGTVGTQWDNASVGIGNDAREALDDCLESIAAQGFDVEDLEDEILSAYPDFADDSKVAQSAVVSTGDDCELYYHVGIRWNASK